MIMENYEKGEVKELGEPPKLSPVEGTVCMRVAYGSKIKNLMGFALKKIKASTSTVVPMLAHQTFLLNTLCSILCHYDKFDY